MLTSIMISIFSVVPALVFWIFCVNFCVKRAMLISKGEKTMGTIIDWNYHKYFNSKNIDFYYSPTIKFLDDKNLPHTFESDYKSSIGKIWSGMRFSDSKVKVIYNKENPIECEMNNVSALWGSVITPFILAVLFSGISILSIKELFVVNMSLDRIFEVSPNQLFICMMLLVLFMGILVLWDLFRGDSNEDSKSNKKIKNKEDDK